MSVTIHGTVKRATDRAILIGIDLTQHWMPKSQIESINGDETDNFIFVGDNTQHEIVISDWIAEQKGLVLNEERYTVVPPEGAATWYVIMDGTRKIGAAADAQRANMIAAALNMTIGKV